MKKGLVLGLMMLVWLGWPQVVAANCQYGSTQARVQRNIYDPWKQYMEISLGESFRTGSFHDGTGQFAGDTYMFVTGPGFGYPPTVGNETVVRPTVEGTYVLNVVTRGRYGGGCEEKASVVVKKPAAACRYGSTQSRVQRDIRDPWKQQMTIRLGESFNVGGFHDHTGRFAGDVKIEVINPAGRAMVRRNGEAFVPKRTGMFRVRVTTPGQTGEACRQVARVEVR